MKTNQIGNGILTPIPLLRALMRFFILFFCTTVFSFSSVSTFSQQKVLIEQDGRMGLPQMFAIIRTQTTYKFIYPKSAFENSKEVLISKGELSVEELLKKCLSPNDYQFEIQGENIIVFSKSSLPETPFQYSVNGQIMDSKGIPLPGVYVVEKGTRNGVATDFDGTYSINVRSRESTLVFSMMGFETMEVRLSDAILENNQLNINLRESLNELQEVILTGYYSLAKERTAGSFSKPLMDVVENRTTSMNVLQRLDGLVPGLAVNNSPGASQNQFLIRGLSTIGVPDPNDPNSYIGTNRNPLYVVDGVPFNDVSFVNPQDVEDITVLKDATAASIWGSRASNGVIVITTKKGKMNQKLQVRYDGFTSFQGKPDLDYFPVLNSREFVQAARDVFDPISYPWSTVSTYSGNASNAVPPHEQILYDQYRGLISDGTANERLDSLATINNVNEIGDTWYRNAMLINHSISISGGGDKHSFYGSLGVTDQKSSNPGDKNNTYKINLRQDFRFNERVQMYLITDLNHTASSSKRPLNIDNRFYPYQSFRDAAGNSLSMPYMGTLSDSIRLDHETRSGIDLNYNPLDEYHLGSTKTSSLLNRIVGGVSIGLLDKLKFEGTYGFIKGNIETQTYDDELSYLVRNELVQFTVLPAGSDTPIYYLPDSGGQYLLENQQQQNWTVRNQLAYSNSWNDGRHQLSTVFGHEAQEQFTRLNATRLRGYNPDLLTYGIIDYNTLGTTGVINPVFPNSFGRSILFNDLFNQNELQTRIESYYGNMSYTLNNTYSINGSWRIDQSNLFGIDKSAQNRPVWSVGAKWSLSNEGFLSNAEWLDNLALRGTYGITGNSPSPGIAASYDIYSAVTNGFFPNGVGLTLATPANRSLTWEDTEIINLGMDFGFLGNRISGSIDVYKKTTENLLGELPTNAFTGYPSVIGNYGNMENKGIELSLSTLNIASSNFQWSTLFTMAHNKNEITSVNNVNPITTGNQLVDQQYVTGYPAFAVFAYDYAGLDEVGDPMIYLADGTMTKERNVSLPEDIDYMGTYQPVWTGGMSNSWSYKGFNLTINAIYNLGHVMKRDVNQFYTGRLDHNSVGYLRGDRSFISGNVHAEFNDRWRIPGDEANTNVPSFVSNTSISDTRRDVGYYTNADINVLKADFIKLRDITLSYSLPKTLTDAIQADNISLRLQMSNLMLWKANDYGIDPEFHYGAYGIRTQRSNQGTISLGANISF
jgi:TonB-linked SusC/RagA family outer membrane protein